MFASQQTRLTGVIFWVLSLFCLLLASPVSSGERTVKNGDTVEMHYTGKLQDNSVFDKSEGRGPLKFTVGTGRVIPGMDKGVLGMKVGENRTLTIPPKEAYGERDEKLVFDVPKTNLPPDVKVGAKLQDLRGQMVTVKELKGDTVALDTNHFLAGKTLIFEIKLVSIK